MALSRRARRGRGRSRRGIALLVATCALCACALPARAPRTQAPLRLHEWADRGDAQRQASMGLILEGLEADEQGQGVRARSQYELALQVDAANPFAYLALARHHAEGVEPSRALAFLDQARSLGRSEGLESAQWDAALSGLRGQALRALGRYTDAEPWLERAREQAPLVWRDGMLDAVELY